MKSYLDEQNVDYDDAWTTEYLSNLVRRRKRRAGGAAGCYHGMWSIFLISVNQDACGTPVSSVALTGC